MGPRLGLAIGVIVAVALSPLSDAYGDRVRSKEGVSKAKKKRGASRGRARALVSPALSLSGTFGLSSINGAAVRDVELAKSKVTFSPQNVVSVVTACNGFGTTLQSRTRPNQILGFSQTIHTLIGCPSNQSLAEATTARLFRETANIARAGNTITFFNAVGINIAQWTATPRPPPIQQPPTPQPAAPPRRPVGVVFGDYVLTQMNGVLFASAAAQAPSTNTTSLPVSSSQPPTFFLRENGQVTGSSGCNQFNAALVQARDGSTRFGPVVTTKKACLNPTMRATETAFFTAMRRAVRVEVSGSQVVLFGPNGQPSARLSAIGARPEASPSLYGKTRVLRRFNGTVISQLDRPTIIFLGNKASGSTGCYNQFDLDHNRANGRSRFTNPIMTEMGCGDRRRDDLQTRYVAQLQRVTIINATASTLTLRSADNTTNMMFDAQ